jgi:hypothetical protein
MLFPTGVGTGLLFPTILQRTLYIVPRCDPLLNIFSIGAAKVLIVFRFASFFEIFFNGF